MKDDRLPKQIINTEVHLEEISRGRQHQHFNDGLRQMQVEGKYQFDYQQIWEAQSE